MGPVIKIIEQRILFDILLAVSIPLNFPPRFLSIIIIFGAYFLAKLVAIVPSPEEPITLWPMAVTNLSNIRALLITLNYRIVKATQCK
jgi:hypothetical protein